MLHHRAAHDGNLDCGIEQRKIDADFRTVERALVLGVEKARIALRHHRGFALAVDRRAVAFHLAVALQLRQQRLRIRSRQQHGMAEVAAGALAAEHRREQQPLIDLEAALVTLRAIGLGGDLLRPRNQTRHQARGPRHQLLHPHEA